MSSRVVHHLFHGPQHPGGAAKPAHLAALCEHGADARAVGAFRLQRRRPRLGSSGVERFAVNRLDGNREPELVRDGRGDVHSGGLGRDAEPRVRCGEVRHLAEHDVRAKHGEVLANRVPGVEHEGEQEGGSAVGLRGAARVHVRDAVGGCTVRDIREEHASLAAVPDARREHLERGDADVRLSFARELRR